MLVQHCRSILLDSRVAGDGHEGEEFLTNGHFGLRTAREIHRLDVYHVLSRRNAEDESTQCIGSRAADLRAVAFENLNNRVCIGSDTVCTRLVGAGQTGKIGNSLQCPTAPGRIRELVDNLNLPEEQRM